MFNVGGPPLTQNMCFCRKVNNCSFVSHITCSPIRSILIPRGDISCEANEYFKRSRTGFIIYVICKNDFLWRRGYLAWETAGQLSPMAMWPMPGWGWTGPGARLCRAAGKAEGGEQGGFLNLWLYMGSLLQLGCVLSLQVPSVMFNRNTSFRLISSNASLAEYFLQGDLYVVFFFYFFINSQSMALP